MLLSLVIHHLVNHHWHHEILKLLDVEHLASIGCIINLFLALFDIALHTHVLVSLINFIGIQRATLVNVH